MNSQDFRELQEAYLEVVENQQLDEMPYQVMGSPDGKKERKIGKPVKSRKYADARAAELEDTHKKTGGKYRSQYVEDYDLYDIILSHLLDEGYAETLEAAEAIMVNMSEEWRDDIMEISDRKVKAVRNAREKQWNKQFGKNRVQDPTDDMVDKVDKLIDQRNKRTGSNVKKTTMGQLHDKNVARRRGEA